MRVAFVYREVESLAEEALSAHLRRHGHETTLVFDPAVANDEILKSGRLSRFFDVREALVDEIVASRPDIVAFSVMTETFAQFRRIAAALKARAPEIPTIFGGIHATSAPEEVIAEPFVDVLCRGEGEEPFRELLDRFGEYRRGGARDIANLWFNDGGEITRNEVRPLVSDLDTFPHWDKDLYFSKLPEFQHRYAIMASRGCPYTCTFCCNSYYLDMYRGKGSYLRQRSVDHVVSELVAAKKRYKVKCLRFLDDIFTWNKAWLRDFAREHERHVGIPIKCFSHLNQLDEESVSYLVQARTKFVNIGVQSVNEEARKGVLKRGPGTNEKIASVIAMLKRAGIGVLVDHITGTPEGEDLTEAARFYNRTRPSVIQVYDLTAYPGTKMVDILREKSMLSEDEIRKIAHGNGAGYLRGGSVESERRARNGFRTLMGWLPLIPRPLANLLIEKKLYRHLPGKGFFMPHILPRLIASPFNGEFAWDKEELRGYAARIRHAMKLRKARAASGRDASAPPTAAAPDAAPPVSSLSPLSR